MEVKLTGPKTLTLPSSAVAYILDKLSECPFKDVNLLIQDIFTQLKLQENQDEEYRTGAIPAGTVGVQPAGPAD